MVMGDESCLRGHGFESRAPYTGWSIFTFISCKNCIVCLKILKINEKEAGVGPFKKKLTLAFKVHNHSQKFRIWLMRMNILKKIYEMQA